MVRIYWLLVRNDSGGGRFGFLVVCFLGISVNGKGISYVMLLNKIFFIFVLLKVSFFCLDF